MAFTAGHGASPVVHVDLAVGIAASTGVHGTDGSSCAEQAKPNIHEPHRNHPRMHAIVRIRQGNVPPPNDRDVNQKDRTER